MKTDEFSFDLPKKLIADFPLSPRDYARMIVYNKDTDSKEEARFFNLPRYLGLNDVLVFNNSKVIPSRLRFEYCHKQIEIFFVEKEGMLWKCMVKPGKRLKAGVELEVYDLKLTVEKVDNDGFRYIHCDCTDRYLIDFLKKHGQMPVPPYIGGKKYNDDEYNTIYSKSDGSIAAPTAGLHFTKQLISRLRGNGVKIEFVTLHVGLGTFLPIKVKDSRYHHMHTEKYEINYGTARKLNRYISEGKRIIAVGTTSVRVMEDNFNKFGEIHSGKYNTNIFITPGYTWGVVNGLITNFHLPKSTLIMLVSALVGRENTLNIYEYAKAKGYRFYSFGDGMLII